LFVLNASNARDSNSVIVSHCQRLGNDFNKAVPILILNDMRVRPNLSPRAYNVHRASLSEVGIILSLTIDGNRSRLLINAHMHRASLRKIGEVRLCPIKLKNGCRVVALADRRKLDDIRATALQTTNLRAVAVENNNIRKCSNRLVRNGDNVALS